MNRHAAKDALAERYHNLVVLLDFLTYQTTQGAAVLLMDNDIVGHIHKTTGQITCIGSLKRGIGKTLTGTVGGNEVLQH